jgi:bifunctional UDP-N-acetylglucosamine pyrophosphorylase/glucosamine-1-phosphate N-acetyltransferase
MKAVILAAGEGKRMRPLTYTRPKVMLPVAGKPILQHLLLEFKEAGISDFLIVIGYHSEMVRDYFGDGKRRGVNIDYIMQRKQLGTADALKAAEGLAGTKFLVVNGDVIIRREDISRLVARDECTMGLIEVEGATDVGVVEVGGNKVMRIHEKVKKPPTNLVNAGIYCLTSEIFSAISATPKSPRGEYELTDSLQLLIDKGSPVFYQMITYWLDLSYPWDLLKINEEFMACLEPQNMGRVEENVVLKDPVLIGKGTVIKSGCYIVGPVIIGEDCEIGPNCYIRPSTVIGNGCHIGSSVEVKNSIIMRGSKVPHHNYIGDSIIGENCNFGAGTKVANLRLDKKEIKAMGMNTGRRKLGAIVGDGVQTGINASLNVGCIIGNDSFIGPGAVASGVILPNSRIF